MFFRPCSANWDRKDPHDDYCANITIRWVIVVDSARSFCYDGPSCASRARNLTTSNGLPFSAFIDGLLSPAPEVNPNLYKAISVFVPYCTSDLWLGTSETFQGQAVLDAVFDRLLSPMAPFPRLIDADEVLIVGPVGVMLAVDDLAARMAAAARVAQPPGKAQISSWGVLDGGVCPSLPPFNASRAPCTSDADCPPATALAMGVTMWGLTPTSPLLSWCAAAAAGRPSECFLDGTLLAHLAANLTTPILVQQQRGDELLLRALGAWPEATIEGTPAAAWATQELAPALARALAAAPASFSAACGRPSQLAISPAAFNLNVRFVDTYNHTQLHPLAFAVSKFLDDPLSSFGVFADNCTEGAWCSPGGCVVEPSL